MSFHAQWMSQRLRKLTFPHHVPSVHLMFYWQQGYTKTIFTVSLVMIDRIICKGVVCWSMLVTRNIYLLQLYLYMYIATLKLNSGIKLSSSDRGEAILTDPPIPGFRSPLQWCRCLFLANQDLKVFRNIALFYTTAPC